ncbi:MAG: C40 family peptidase [Bacteroidetes bacterium]|nr:C40 family peptidase [Bacteroidota bacterium]
MHRRTIVKVLLLLSLIVGLASMPSTLEGHPSRTGTEDGKTLSKAERQKLARKNRALSVLREHLPRYADILEAEMLRFEDAFHAGDMIMPIKSDYDVRSPFANPFMRLQLMQVIDTWLGTRYRFGGRSKAGIDCSGFTSKVISEALGRDFTGNSRMQARRFTAIMDTDSLQFGDLIFFTGTNRRSRMIGHVGIYLGEGLFSHSGSTRGVTFNHLSDGYYTQRFRFGGRFIKPPTADVDRSRVYANP